MTGLRRVMIGALGGLAAVIVKAVGQNRNFFVESSDLPSSELLGAMLGYILLAVGLMFLGGLVTWASEETNRLRLLALGIAAPALITTWTGSASGGEPPQPPQPPAAIGLVIAPAYAGPGEVTKEYEPSFGSGFKKGIAKFLGIRKEPKFYWVVAGSSKDREEARAIADRINQESNDLNAFVGMVNKETGWWPVIVGYGTYSQAQGIKKKALELDSVTEAFLSPS